MDAERLERAARALLEHRDARMAALKATEDEDRPDARGFAWGALTSAESREEAAVVALRAALAAPAPAQAGEAVAWEAARFMIAKVTDVCNKIDRDLKSCDGPASERRRLDTLARGAMAVWAALDESVVREAVSHALRAQRPGGAS